MAVGWGRRDGRCIARWRTGKSFGETSPNKSPPSCAKGERDIGTQEFDDKTLPGIWSAAGAHGASKSLLGFHIQKERGLAPPLVGRTRPWKQEQDPTNSSSASRAAMAYTASDSRTRGPFHCGKAARQQFRACCTARCVYKNRDTVCSGRFQPPKLRSAKPLKKET